MLSKRWAKIYGQFEGIHSWPDAPVGEKYLRNPHRHMFGVVVHIEVLHDDRSVEYYNFKQYLNIVLISVQGAMDSHDSCEMLCNRIYYEIIKRYPHRDMKIEVNEDFQEGALYEYDTK